MASYSIDAVVAGAGVIGLAVARRLALAGFDVLVVERNDQIGAETSSRNSEVVHAGLYYPTNSVKAKTCLAGNRWLYRYCESRGVDVRNCGKLMVATSDAQVPKLRAIWDQAHVNGVEALTWLSPQEARALEPEVSCVAAFLSSTTGIVDSHGYMLALQGDLESAGGAIAFGSPIVGAAADADGIRLEIGDRDQTEINTRIFVNSAGHGAPTLASRIEGLPKSLAPQQWYAKGNYFALVGRQPFSRLVYPVPESAGLGVHSTLDRQGRCRFGPDVEWVDDNKNFEVDPARSAAFYAAIRTYWAGLPDGALQPDYAGIRPKLHARGTPIVDFRIDGPETHQIGGLVNLFGIESPGLTCSLAVAELVAAKLSLPPLPDAAL